MKMMNTYFRSCAYKMIQGKSFHRGTTYSFHRGFFKEVAKVVCFFWRVGLTHSYAFHSFAYAKSLCLDMLTRCLREKKKSLDRVSCTNMQREFTHEVFSITMLQHQASFFLAYAAHGAGLHINSKHFRFFQFMGQQFVSSILFLQLTEGVDAFVLWCYTSTALKDHIFHYADFSLGGIVGKWLGKWSRRQLGLTHALRKSLTMHWENWGSA